MTLSVVQKADHCEPSENPPGGDQQDMCDGTINGTVRIECCCNKIMTRTFVVNIGPQTEASLITYLQNTVNAYENAGYMVLAHSLVDTGAGWALGLSVGYYS